MTPNENIPEEELQEPAEYHVPHTQSHTLFIEPDEPSSSQPSNTDTSPPAPNSRPPKSHSSGTDTQGKIDAQIQADIEGYDRPTQLDSIEEAQDSEPEESKSHGPDSDPDQPKPSTEFETAPDEPPTHDAIDSIEIAAESRSQAEPELEPGQEPEPEASADEFETAPQLQPSNASSSSEQTPSESDHRSTPRPQPRAFQAESTSPNAYAPAKSSAAPVQKQRPAKPPSPTASQASTEPVPTVAEWVMSRLSPETPAPAVVEALRATNGDTSVTDVLLARMRSGSVRYDAESPGKSWIPQDMRGVWTAEDDEALRNGESAGRERVGTKHGRDGIEARMHFWSHGG